MHNNAEKMLNGNTWLLKLFFSAFLSTYIGWLVNQELTFVDQPTNVR